MKKSIIVIDANKDQREAFCELLKESPFKARVLDSSHKLEHHIKHTGCRAVFWDIDTVPVDNRTMRALTLKFPNVYFFCLSKHAIHPELRDAISRHIYACLNRPIDMDELYYWLGSIEENEANSAQPTTH